MGFNSGFKGLNDVTDADIRVTLYSERGGNVPPCVLTVKFPLEHTLQDNVLLFVEPTPLVSKNFLSRIWRQIY